MNQRSTNRSFDAAMLSFKTRQRLDGRGVGQDEGDGSALGSVGGLALCAGLGLHGLDAACEVVTNRLGRNLVAPEFGVLGDEVPHVAAIGHAEATDAAKRNGVAGQQVVFGQVGKGQLHGSAHQLAEFGGDADSQRVGVAGVGHSAFRREATELAGLGVSGLDGDLAEVGGGSAVAGSDAVNVNLAARHGDHAGSDLCGGECGVHGLLQTGPIPAMSNPKPVTSDVSSPFGKRIMNEPIPYTVTPEGRAIAAAYKKRQEEANGHG